MKRTGLFLAIGTVVFALLIVACKKDNKTENPSSDYRDAWIGGYFYNLYYSSWNPQTSYVDHYTGNLSVTPVGDNCVGIQLADSTRYWLCEISADGYLKLIDSNQSWRGFVGCFPKSDSLSFYCTNYSPASGVSLRYYCNR